MPPKSAVQSNAIVPRINFFDRVIMALFPKWGLARVRSRLISRHFEAASVGRRTGGWSRRGTDANAAASGATLGYLRAQARDLVRNNPWARRGLRRLVTNTIGWGIKPKATGKTATRVMALFKGWGESTECDAAGRLTFYGLQRLVMRTIVESGEVLIRRRLRRPEDGLSVPLQLQVLEPDYLDISRDIAISDSGGPIVQGIEFDQIGRRVAYWMFDQHPGSVVQPVNFVSRRIPASEIIHVYDQERAGQVRGVPWFASVDVRLHEFDEFEDATLMKQKIAACMAAFVTDLDGSGVPLGEASTDSTTGQNIDTFEPGMILNLPAGKQVTVANPPASTDHQAYSTTALRGVAAGLGLTYEDLTGDMTQVNFSSGRMGRIVAQADIEDWRWNMLIPQFCTPVWNWMQSAISLGLGEDIDASAPEWTPPAMPMIDPSTEGLALARLVRAGAKTHDEMVREQGYDPDQFWAEYAKGLERLDQLGIVLDSDPRRTSSAGQLQQSSPVNDANDAADRTDNDNESSDVTIGTTVQ